MEEIGKKGRSKYTYSVRAVAVFAGVLALAVSPLFATLSYTPVYSPPAGEKNHAQILSMIYGGCFLKIGTVNYGNAAGVRAWRVYDYGDNNIRLNLLTGSPDDVDQVWTDGIALVTAEAKYAVDNQSFGWNLSGLGTDTYQELLNDDSLGQSGITIDITGDFLWGYMPNGEEWWSMQSENYRCEDHMVTYRIEGLAGRENEAIWLIFLEDRPFVLWEGCRWYKASDRDYNDFVVEISAVIPEPVSAVMLGLGTVILFLRRKR